MPTTIVNAHATRMDGNVDLTLEFDERHYTVSLPIDKVNTPEKLAAWLLAQPFPAETDSAEYRRRLTITWHVETTADGQARVLDGVVSEISDEETAWAALLASPLGTVTLETANAAVDAIANLADARAYLKKMNAVIIAERDVIKRILALLKAQRLR